MAFVVKGIDTLEAACKYDSEIVLNAMFPKAGEVRRETMEQAAGMSITSQYNPLTDMYHVHY